MTPNGTICQCRTQRLSPSFTRSCLYVRARVHTRVPSRHDGTQAIATPYEAPCLQLKIMEFYINDSLDQKRTHVWRALVTLCTPRRVIDITSRADAWAWKLITDLNIKQLDKIGGKRGWREKCYKRRDTSVIMCFIYRTNNLWDIVPLCYRF